MQVVLNRAKCSLRFFLAATLLLVVLPFNAWSKSDDNEALKKLREFTAEKRPANFNDFLQDIPQELTAYGAFNFDSQSPVLATPQEPRIITLNENATLLTAVNCSGRLKTGQPTNEVEVASFNSQLHKYEPKLLLLDGGEVQWIENPNKYFAEQPERQCIRCHGQGKISDNDFRPIWDAYTKWPGFFGQAHGGNTLDLTELENMARFQKFQSQNPGVMSFTKRVLGQNLSETTMSQKNFSARDAFVYMNIEITKAFSQTTSQRVIAILKAHSEFDLYLPKLLNAVVFSESLAYANEVSRNDFNARKKMIKERIDEDERAKDKRMIEAGSALPSFKIAPFEYDNGRDDVITALSLVFDEMQIPIQVLFITKNRNSFRTSDGGLLALNTLAWAIFEEAIKVEPSLKKLARHNNYGTFNTFATFADENREKLRAAVEALTALAQSEEAVRQRACNAKLDQKPVKDSN